MYVIHVSTSIVILIVICFNSSYLSGTSILKIIIGDENDNKMQPGQKNITVYLYEEKSPKSEIGQVYVWDQDDWDLEDKTFRWFNQSSHPLFNLDKDTGMIKMNGEQISPGKYSLRKVFRVVCYTFYTQHFQLNY